MSNYRILQFLHKVFTMQYCITRASSSSKADSLAAGRCTLKMCRYRSRLVFNCCF